MRLVACDHFGGDLAFVARFVSEHRLAADVADRVDVRDVGAQLLVDRNVTALVDVDAGRFGFDLAPVGPAADRHEDVIVDLRRGRLVAFERDFQAVFLRLDLRHLGFQQDFS